MEQLIPIIIAAIVFGFQAYNNYQKEQEKARKRNPGQPRQPVADEPASQERPAPFDWLEELIGEPRPQQPVPAPTRQKSPEIPVVQQEEPSRSDVRDPFQSYSGAFSEEEFHRKRRERQQKRTPSKAAPVTLLVAEEESQPVHTGEFDLRDAVIKAAILERPYRY